MSFNTSEFSEDAARPVFLLKLSRSGKSWYYTNADQDIMFDGNTYASAPIIVPAIVQSGNVSDEKVLSVTVPRAIPLAQYLDLLIPTSQITLTPRKAHMEEDPGTGGYTAPVAAFAPVFWIGLFVSVGRPTPNSRVLNFVMLSLARGGLRLSWSSTCGHMLYGPACRVDKALYAVALTAITVIDAVSLSAAELGAEASGWFSGGFLEWESEPGVVERNGIDTHDGSVVTLIGFTSGMDAGANFVAYPGCARVPDVCDTKFDNMPNYGGINHLTNRSPFDGDPVF